MNNSTPEITKIHLDSSNKSNHEHIEKQIVNCDVLSSSDQSGSSDKEAAISWRSWLLVAVTTFAIFSQIYTTVASGANIAFIIRDLGEPGIAGWIIQGPLLIQSVMSPIFGRISDEFGRKWLAVVPPIIAAVGSIVAAKSTSMTMLIGGGILVGPVLASISIVQSISAEVLPLRWRAIAGGLAFMGGTTGGLAGSLAGGKMCGESLDGWRNIFWLQCGLHILTAIGFFFTYWPQPVTRSMDRSVKAIFWRFDSIGTALYMASVSTLLLALNWAGGTYSWKSAHVLAPLILGVFLLFTFAIYEWKGRDDGLVAHALFERGRNFPISIWAMIVEGWIFYGAVNSIIPQVILNLGFESSGIRVAVRNLVSSIPSLMTALPIMWYVTKYRDLKYPLLVSLSLFLVSNICYSTLTQDQADEQYGYSLIMGIGQAAPLAILITLVQYSAPYKYLSATTGLGFSARSIGGAFGSAILNVIINNHLNKDLAPKITNAAVGAGLDPSSVPGLLQALAVGDPTLIASVPGVNPAIIRVSLDASHKVYAKAYRLSFLSVIPFVVIAIVSCAFLKSVKEHMTMHIEATVEPKAPESANNKGV